MVRQKEQVKGSLGLTKSIVPAARAIKLEIATIDIDRPNLFMGNPSKDIDEAWDNLIHGQCMFQLLCSLY